MTKRFPGRSAARKRMVKRPPRPSWHLALSGGLVLAAIVVLLYAQWRERPQEPIPPEPPSLPAAPAPDAVALADTLYEAAETVLDELGIDADLIRKTRTEAGLDRIEVRVPVDLPLPVVNLHLTRFVEARGGQVLGAVETEPEQRVELRCGFAAQATTRFTLVRDRSIRRRTGQIAIVVDDVGYMSWDGRMIERFCALSQPLTLAILPNEGRVDGILALARKRGHEVILHLPMEPDDPGENPGEGAIRLDQTDEEIRQQVRQALRKVSSAVGINNHMGSRATTDSRVMELVLGELKTRDLFFLDSRTSAESVAYGLARGMDVPALSRDLFIDPVDDRQAIEARLWELAGLAGRAGQAIGIGHDRENTLLALQTVLPRLETRGFRVVTLSHLVR